MHTLRYLALVALCSACSPRLGLLPYVPLDGSTSDGEVDSDADAREVSLTFRRDAQPRDTEARVEVDAPEPRDAADTGPMSDDASVADVVDAPEPRDVVRVTDVADAPEPRDVVSVADVVDVVSAPADVVSVTDVADAPEPHDVGRDAPSTCASAHTCEECLRLTHCGWCGGSSTCMAGSPVGLDVGICWRDYTFVCSP